ncbi:phosphoribosylamine--glycine ligase [Sandarakinorhabdus rubra]|uniref:phosphoribosylamine--glycine ligase n=1 Tax=Sandarakinorhabdus rubra TaxID=2672568 RepID=UPI0013DA8D87|nr:phosphoribosylamine--glycine ligase [Sandarakinorhabdus rubra]
MSGAPDSLAILVLGGGGREHALCWRLAQSPRCRRLLCAPGNAGIAEEAECVALAITDPAAVVEFVTEYAIDLVVIGPEAPLVAGVADALRAAGVAVVGPSQAAAELEASKGFTKDLCAEHEIPTARFRRFAGAADAHHYVAVHPLPVVVKADGLAGGKGVTVATTNEEGLAALAEIQGPVVVEQCLVGPEASLFILTDGETVRVLPSAQDHKRLRDGDEGPNTGGMGAVSPSPRLTPALQKQALERIVLPTLAAMKARGTPFQGFLYAGLMLTAEGPMLIEYNVRLGDPEAQVLMMRLESDLVELLWAAATGTLASVEPRFSSDAAVTVVMAAKGYPWNPVVGTVIDGLAAAEALGVKVFHAGTRRTEAGRLVAAGGRVLNVTASGHDISEARALAYAAMRKINWHGGHFRRDIGKSA